MSSDSESPFYHLVPKDRVENLRFRRKVVSRCGYDEGFRRTILECCSRDILFFLNTFCFTYYPHLKTGTMPLITFGYQDRAILGIRSALGKRDQGIEKSREMGGSLVPLWAFLHASLFERGLAFLVGSRKEDLVDDVHNPDSLFWKLDFILDRLPYWMKGEVRRTSMTMLFERTGSVINGESTNPGFARGGRRTAIMLDEFAHVECDRAVEASTLRATACRIFVSTPRGSSNVFAEQMRKLPRVDVWRFHWSEHPDFSRGLYFDEEGRPRSPWYDEQCGRTHPAVIAQELDIDYVGSVQSYFPREVVERVRREMVREPLSRGFLSKEDRRGFVSFTESPTIHRVKLWLNLENGSPPRDREYGVGVDIATGSVDAEGRGASVSAAMVGDLNTGEMLAELSVSGVMPHEFAAMVYDLGMFFSGLDGESGAHVIWEAMGPGAVFGRTLMDLGYRNVYYRKSEQRYFDGGKGEVPGWYYSKRDHEMLFGSYLRDLMNGDFVNRSLDCVNEHELWVFSPAGGVIHAVASETNDPTGARANHGDRVVATVLLNHIMRRRAAKSKLPDKYPRGTIGHLFERMAAETEELRYVI